MASRRSLAPMEKLRTGKRLKFFTIFISIEPSFDLVKQRQRSCLYQPRMLAPLTVAVMACC